MLEAKHCALPLLPLEQTSTNSCVEGSNRSAVSGSERAPGLEKLWRNHGHGTGKYCRSGHDCSLFGITGNKVDASKLEKAWTKAGSPTDSEEIKQILVSAGVDEQLVATAFADLGIEVSPTSADPAGETVNIEELLAQISKLSAAEQKEILAYAQA